MLETRERTSGDRCQSRVLVMENMGSVPCVVNFVSEEDVAKFIRISNSNSLKLWLSNRY